MTRLGTGRRSPIRALLEKAERGDLDAAHVLADVLLEGGDHAAEDLVFALQGRTWPAGAALKRDAAARNLKDAIRRVRMRHVPIRERPCMPSREALLELLDRASHHHRWGPGDYPVRTILRELWSRLRTACRVNSWAAHESAMGFASEVLGGYGVERVDVATLRGGTPSFEYVNLGDPYVSTLIWDLHDNRYRVAGWGDLVERWERRWGER